MGSDDYVILVTGSRAWQDYDLIEDTILGFIEAAVNSGKVTSKDQIVIRHGGCPTGADHIANDVAKRKGFRIDEVKADWRRYGGSAGPIRNKQMVDKGADLCLAFPQGKSKGTYNCLGYVNKANIPTIIIPGEDTEANK